ncbi:MAG: endonuclease III [Eubacterium sp.]|nr:endonuclease III [Eubacterium sp.]
MNRQTVNLILDRLENMYPDADCALHHKNVFELIIAVALSAQTTDKSVNKVTPQLFETYPNAEALASANPLEVETYIRRIGMYKTKSKNIVNLAKSLVSEYDGKVPQDFKALTSLAGVGRKTANVVLSVGFGEPHIAVDTHVFRVSNRIGLCKEENELMTEKALMKAIPKYRWSKAHHLLIFHGRQCCNARRPDCENCGIESLCKKRIKKDK